MALETSDVEFGGLPNAVRRLGAPPRRQVQFGRDKRDTLPEFCRSCEGRFACHGGCPKNRFTQTPDGEPGLNYLCAGCKHFLGHIGEPMRSMCDLLNQRRAPSALPDVLAAREAERYAHVGRNDPCPCGSGLKFKRCHGTSALT